MGFLSGSAIPKETSMDEFYPTLPFFCFFQ